MSFILLLFLKEKIVACSFWILLVCTYSLDQSQTTLLLLCNTTSRSAIQPDVFLLPAQSAGALKSLIKISFAYKY
jgi:hypothetical protein